VVNIPEKFDKFLLFILIYSFTFIVFFKTLSYTLPFVLALICALIIKKPTELLTNNLKLKKSFASIITTLVFFAVILTLLTIGVTQFSQEAYLLGKNFQNYISVNSSDLLKSFENLKIYYNNLDPYIISTIESNFANLVTELSNLTVSISSRVFTIFLGILGSIPYIITVIVFTMLATYFFTKDITTAKNKIFNLFPREKSEQMFLFIYETKKMLGNYFLSYMTIIGITFIETLIVFLVFKVKYAIILTIICACFDILPILGIGAIYIPLALIYLFLIKSYITAAGIIISYVIISIIRQIIEPKIVSSSLGIHPVATLAAIFIGLKANGISGMLFCIFLVIFYNVLKKVDIL